MQTGALFFVAGLVLCVAERCTDGVIRKALSGSRCARQNDHAAAHASTAPTMTPGEIRSHDIPMRVGKANRGLYRRSVAAARVDVDVACVRLGRRALKVLKGRRDLIVLHRRPSRAAAARKAATRP